MWRVETGWDIRDKTQTIFFLMQVRSKNEHILVKKETLKMRMKNKEGLIYCALICQITEFKNGK